MKKMDMKVTTFHVSKAAHQSFKMACAKEGKSMSTVLTELLEAYARRVMVRDAE